MAAPKTITINGRLYDALTGLPVETPQPVAKPISKVAAVPALKKAKPAAPRPEQAATTIHGSVQRSTTLARRVAKKPVAPVKKPAARLQAGRHMDIAQSNIHSKKISKFAPNPVIQPKTASASPVKPNGIPNRPVSRGVTTPSLKPSLVSADKPAQVHPSAGRALAKANAKKQAQAKAARPQTAKQVKDAAISTALAAPKPAPGKSTAKNKWKKRALTIAIILVVLLGALYLVYRFIPAVSVGIASSSAGISARYPDYIPDGFSFHQPVSYSDGEVVLTFASNSNKTSYTISQKRSSWDSSAVLDNVVQPLVGDNYTTTKERGLTIYTYARGAAWANGGILYTVSGDATLSSDQIRHIATSL